MAAATIPPITVEQFLNFETPDGFRAELIRGEIVLSPYPKPLHHDVVENIFDLLKKAVRQEFKVGSRCNMNLEKLFSMPSPDVFVLTRELWQQAREGEYYPLGAHLLAVEVLSPANRSKNLRAKTELYLEAGSLAVWNVSVKQRSVAVHVPKREVFTRQAGEVIQLPAALGSVAIAVDDFFKLS